MIFLLREMFFSLFAVALLVSQLSACQTMTASDALSARQITLLQQQGFTQGEDGWELSFADKLLFGIDAYELTEQSRAAVQKISKALLSVGIRHLRVEGHTDTLGAYAYNHKLSILRATAVADALSKAGIRHADITVHGMGKGKPIADNATAAGRAENRRVAIIVLAFNDLPGCR